MKGKGPNGLQRDWFLSFRMPRRDSRPATPIRRTYPALKASDPETESFSRWIARSRARHRRSSLCPARGQGIAVVLAPSVVVEEAGGPIGLPD